MISPKSLKTVMFWNHEKSNKRLLAQSNRCTKIRYEILSISDSAYLCSTGAKTCYGLEVDPAYDKNLKHIDKVLGYGHDSISAHSNVVVVLKFSSNGKEIDLSSLFYCLPAMKFMNISILPFYKEESEDYDERDIKYLLLSGTARAFRYFIQKYNEYYIDTPDYNSDLYEIIKDIIYSSFEKEFFTTFIKDGILNEDLFGYSAPMDYSDSEVDEEGFIKNEVSPIVTHHKSYTSNRVDILYTDSIVSIFTKLVMIAEQNKLLVNWDILLSAILECTVTTMRLHDYSRAISQQINRHRSGISQESQRYVNYAKAKFIDPLPINQKVYTEPSKKYSISLGGSPEELSSEELGKRLLSIYTQLKDQGMANQEARSFLPMNVETKAIHTFTNTDLLHFLDVRDHQAAQPEVQLIAREIKELLSSIIEDDINSMDDTLETTELQSSVFQFIRQKIKPVIRV